MASYGQSVYPITGGVVTTQISSEGWTSGGTTNIAVIMAHTTVTGQQVRALYSHVEKATLNSLVKTGAWIPAGTSIGKVGAWSDGNHLHFGINVLDLNTALPFKGQDASTPLASIIGYDRIGVNHWQGTWPDRTSNANDWVAQSDETAPGRADR